MSTADDERPRWRWTTQSDFSHPDHPEWDQIEWDLHDELVWDPRKVSRPVTDDEDDPFRYLTTKEAPGLAHLPPMIVLFQIVREPSDTDVGLIQGIAAWPDDDDLVTTLMRRVRGLPF